MKNMQNSLYTACDLCAKVLEGKKGTADIKRNYIGVKGSLLWAHVEESEEGQVYRYTYAQPKHETTVTLHFCDEGCLIDYLKAKETLWKQAKSVWNYDEET